MQSLFFRRRHKLFGRTSVDKAGAVDAVKDARYSNSNCIVVVWPGYNEPWVADALEEVLGSSNNMNKETRLIFWGEGKSGAAANDRLFDILDNRLELVDEIIPQRWHNIHDTNRVYSCIPAMNFTGDIICNASEAEEEARISVTITAGKKGKRARRRANRQKRREKARSAKVATKKKSLK